MMHCSITVYVVLLCSLILDDSYHIRSLIFKYVQAYQLCTRKCKTQAICCCFFPHLPILHMARVFPTYHYLELLTCRHVTRPRGRHFDQNVSNISLPRNVNLSTCHMSQRVDTLTRMFPASHYLELFIEKIYMI